MCSMVCGHGQGILKAFALLPSSSTVVALEKFKALISSGRFLVPSVNGIYVGYGF